MLLRPTREFQQVSPAQIVVANFPSQTFAVDLPQNQPIEWIDVIFNVTMSGTAITNARAGGLLNICKRLTVEFNDGVRGKRNVVNISGLALLEYNMKVYNSLDPNTLLCLSDAIAGGHAANQKYRICYRIPFAHPQITAEPLRSRFYLPAHLTSEQPRLTIVTGAAADMGTGGDTIAALSIEVVSKQRFISANQQAALQKEKGAGLRNGYFAQDLIETQYTLAASLTDSEQRFAIPQPGQYTGIMVRQVAYAATVLTVYSDLSASTTPGTETVWTLEQANQTYAKFRWYQLWLEQAMAGFRQTAILVTSPDFLPTLASNTKYAVPSSIYLDFLAEGEGGEADEFSSLLDCNIPSNQGIRMEFVGRCTTVAGGNSYVGVVGHRILDDLRPWQMGRLIG